MSTHPELYACLLVRELPAQALLRMRPELCDRACAVMEGEPPMRKVCSINSRAQSLGIEHGMTQVEVDTFPTAIALTRSWKEEQAVRTALLECSGNFSPRIEDCSGDCTFLCVVDISGTRGLFGTPKILALSLLSRIGALRMEACIAVSSNFHTAVAVAKSLFVHGSVRIVTDGEEAAALAPLPLTVLDLSEDQASTLALWGIRTLGTLAELPETELVARLGQKGKRLRQLACGEMPHLFQPVEPTLALSERMELDCPAECLDALLFLLNLLLEQLIHRASARILALASVMVSLTLDGGGAHIRTVRPALPCNDRQLWLKLLRLDLETHPPQAAILAVELKAEPGEKSKVQLGLFAPQLPEPSRLDVTLARILSLVGENNVGRASLTDKHAQDSFRMEQFSVTVAKTSQVSAQSLRPALRRLRPPETVFVTVEIARPAVFTFRSRRYSVERVYGPWQASGDWWNATHWEAEEWDLSARSKDGAMLCCCMVRDLLRNQWKMTGLYD